MTMNEYFRRIEERRRAALHLERKGGEVPYYLEADYRCPLCGKYVHDIDVWNHPLPRFGPKRREDEICQCQRGKIIREMRREYRNARILEERKRERQLKEAQAADARKKAFWERVERAKVKQRIRDGGSLTAGVAGEYVDISKITKSSENEEKGGE